MQEYKETDTVQDLYNEIENLIDIPFEMNSCQPIEKKGFDCNQEELNNDYTFDRPILIESDSDDIEEELATPEQFCFQCDKQILPNNNNSLTVTTSNNVCHECSTKKRTRSGSFTFSQLADKLKQSFGHSSSSNNLLTPAGMTKGSDRRKSIPSMNSLFDPQQQSLEPPSPVPSRPSSRASSFIEDVKQFLAPLSRKSSRNSMYQDFQQSEPQLEKKSSHHSLLDAINICKPSKQKQIPSYERRLIQDTTNWSKEDAEVMGVHQNINWQQDSCTGAPIENKIIPLRRKQIKKIESRQERLDIYNNGYLQYMKVETDLVPWIIKQTQKGPPDAYFGYTPPTREPKKIMGIFKRKTKDKSTSLRAQQQQLGEELLNRSTPLLQNRYSNSNLSVSPSSFVYTLDEQIATSPVCYEDDQDYFIEQNYTPSLTTSPNSSVEPSSSQPVSILKKKSFNIQPQEEYDQEQPVVFKKEKKQRSSPSTAYDSQVNSKNTFRSEHSEKDDYYDYNRSTPLSYRQIEEPTYFNDSIVVNKRRSGNRQVYEDEQDYYQPPIVDVRRRSKPVYQPRTTEEDYYHQSDIRRRARSIHQPHVVEEDYYQPPIMNETKRRSKPIVHEEKEDYYTSVVDTRRRSRALHHTEEEEEEYYPAVVDTKRRSRSLHHTEEEEEEYYPSVVDNKRRSRAMHHKEDPEYYPSVSDTRRRSRAIPHNEEEEEYYSFATDTRRRAQQSYEDEEYYQTTSIADTRSKQTQQEYYGLSAKLTPFMMEEWEVALDDLCDLYPKLDRHFINDFLRSAQGDFVTAKEMILKMIMEIR